MTQKLRARILVLSDGASRGEREDRSGAAVRSLLESHGWTVVAHEVLPDEVDRIRRRLEEWTEDEACDAIFTTGGTGLGPRDVTPEATRAVLEREVPGLAEMMRFEGMKRTKMAVLSRGLAGARRGCLILNLPGSVRGATESLESALSVLPHAIDLLRGRTEHLE